MHALLKHGILKARAYAKNRDVLLQHADARWMTNGEPPFAALTLHYHGVSRDSQELDCLHLIATDFFCTAFVYFSENFGMVTFSL